MLLFIVILTKNVKVAVGNEQSENLITLHAIHIVVTLNIGPKALSQTCEESDCTLL